MRHAYSAIALSTCLICGCNSGGDPAIAAADPGLSSPGAGGTQGNAGATGSAGGAQASGGSGPQGGASGVAGAGTAGARNGVGGSGAGGSGSAPGGGATDPTGTSPVVGGCPILPSNHVFNTPIDELPVHPHSADFMTTIGAHKIHLDLGQSEDMTQPDTYYGIPYNVVHGGALTWASVDYSSADTANMTWDPRPESDCALGSSQALVSPCTAAAAPAPLLPIPSGVLVEGGVFPDVASQDYGDHHILLIDADTCRLWEAYHAYTGSGSTWDIFGSASFDLRSNSLRPADWSSADAAGFPIMPLLLRADEAASGTIPHALRLTIDSSTIRNEYTWPARHLTTNGTTAVELPPMGQLFRIKSSYVVPTSFSVQSRAILQALKTYGVYLADGGSNLYIQGEPSTKWSDAIFNEVQSVGSDQFEAVDLSPIQNRAGFDANSAAVPP